MRKEKYTKDTVIKQYYTLFDNYDKYDSDIFGDLADFLSDFRLVFPNKQEEDIDNLFEWINGEEDEPWDLDYLRNCDFEATFE